MTSWLITGQLYRITSVPSALGMSSKNSDVQVPSGSGTVRKPVSCPLTRRVRFSLWLSPNSSGQISVWDQPA